MKYDKKSCFSLDEEVNDHPVKFTEKFVLLVSHKITEEDFPIRIKNRAVTAIVMRFFLEWDKSKKGSKEREKIRNELLLLQEHLTKERYLQEPKNKHGSSAKNNTERTS